MLSEDERLNPKEYNRSGSLNDSCNVDEHQHTSGKKAGCVVRKGQMFGAWGLVQTLGLILLVLDLFLLKVGFVLLVGVGLSIFGHAKANKYVCSVCGNTLDKEASFCAVCHAQIEGELNNKKTSMLVFGVFLFILLLFHKVCWHWVFDLFE